jgi:hypothetical protein
MRRAALLSAVLVLAPTLTACGSDSDEGSTAVPDTDAPAATAPVTATTEADGPAGALGDQYGVRYCEVLTEEPPPRCGVPKA